MDTWLTTTIPGLLIISVIGAIIATWVIQLLKQLYGWLKANLPKAVKRALLHLADRFFARMRQNTKKRFHLLEEAERRGRLSQYHLMLLMRFVAAIGVTIYSGLVVVMVAVLANAGQQEVETSQLVFAVAGAICVWWGIWQATRLYFWVAITYRLSEQRAKQLLAAQARSKTTDAS